MQVSDPLQLFPQFPPCPFRCDPIQPLPTRPPPPSPPFPSLDRRVCLDDIAQHLQTRNPKKQSNVIGCALRRQLSVPGAGLSIVNGSCVCSSEGEIEERRGEARRGEERRWRMTAAVGARQLCRCGCVYLSLVNGFNEATSFVTLGSGCDREVVPDMQGVSGRVVW